MINQTVTDILCALGIERAKIRDEALLKRDLELDSTDTVQVAIDLKKTLDVEIQFESREDMTIGQLCSRIDRLRNKQPQNNLEAP
jgi:acyl carrier protein